MDFFGLLTRIGAAVGLLLILAALGANGAPQEAALAAMATAVVVLPYAVYRVLQTRREAERRQVFETRVLKALDVMAEARDRGRNAP